MLGRRVLVLFALVFSAKSQFAGTEFMEKATDDTEETGVECEVLVLGAGMAGIAAASKLTQLGMQDIVVVEGSNRIGGRVKEVDFGGIKVEVGANWIHFSAMNHSVVNPIEPLVRQAGLNFVSDDYSDLIFRYNGKNVTDEYHALYPEMEKAFEHALDLSNRKWANNEPDINFRAALALADWRPRLPLMRAAEYFDFDFEFGDEPEDSGLKSNAKIYGDHGKDDMFIADMRGYAHIIRNMANSIPLVENKTLFFNNYVTEVRYREPGKHPVKVVAKDTETGKPKIFRAKWVIMTFSIGVLESDLVTFQPKLPAWKAEVIYMFKMVRYIKIFVKFPSNTTAFWDDNHYIMYCSFTVCALLV